eukprot:comp6177_c0_seq1/m.2005 comp6177_c0_seq1/g.2005  ORF comp6177_c0_seq1/g.2005 comp6177_c0_seq1/m.2005 type:complete len:202 (-) comp6177_c0_seq1:633-1238(-)
MTDSCSFGGALIAAASLGCTIAALVSPSWIQAETEAGQIVHVGPTGACGSDESCIGYMVNFTMSNIPHPTVLNQEFSVSEWRVCFILLAVAAAFLAVAFSLGLASCCLNSLCLFCVGAPLGSISGLFCLVAFVLEVVGVCYFVYRFDAAGVCGPRAGPFQIGDCTLSWGMWSCIGGVAGCLVATVLFGTGPIRKICAGRGK